MGFKRLINRVVGSGPHAIAPFAAIVAEMEDGQQAVHRPEAFDGVLTTEPADATAYTMGKSLLGQVDDIQTIGLGGRYLPAGIAASDQKQLYSLTDAGVLGRTGLIYSVPRRVAVQETIRMWTCSPDQHPALGSPRMPAASAVSGLSLSIAVLDGEGFYHFLLESLPRLWLARAHRTRIDRVFANGSPGAFQERWLAQAGVPANKIVWLNGLGHFRCAQLLFTNYLTRDSQPTHWAVSAIRRLCSAEPPSRPGRRRLWISRSDARTRQPAWETTLLEQLRDFEKVSLSQLSVAEQIESMRSAGIVVGPHGAGLANVVFCAPGTKLVEIFDGQRRTPLYNRLADVCGLRYAWAAVDYAVDRPVPELADAIRRFAESPDHMDSQTPIPS